MQPDSPHILLVNPWIHDFAAYDFWAKPYGLLMLGGILRARGLRVSYIDCLDRFHPRAPVSDPSARHGRGPYLKAPIARPAGLEDVPRTFSRYGIPPPWLDENLAGLPRPDLILVTSLMTYWYPGVFETIVHLRRAWPGVPLVLGGIYARLCAGHARAGSRADEVAGDRGESIFSIVDRFCGTSLSDEAGFDIDDLDSLPPPAFDLQRRISCVPLLTARGCPFRCAYCASHFLEPAVRRRSPRSVVDEIDFWHRRHGVVDFVFYDDALLVDAEQNALPLLEGIVRLNRPLFFHTPNALHIREITAETALLMHAAGFHTLRLGLETALFEQRRGLDAKVGEHEFLRAVGFLKKAGFRGDQVGAYLLAGLPGQSLASIAASIRIVAAAGITPVPAHYTPIPHTRLWPEAAAASRYDLAADPVFTNNAVFPCRPHFSWQELSRLKRLAGRGAPSKIHHEEHEEHEE